MNLQKSLKSHFIINLAGHTFPLLVGVFTIPRLISHLGTERFGALSVVWVLIGYFSLFDFGLSRTLTFFASKYFPDKNWTELRKIFWSIFSLISLSSLIGSLIIFMFKQFELYDYIKASPILLSEISASLIPISISIPIVSAMTALRGMLEADERFYFVNLLQILLGTYTFISPLVLPLEFLNLKNIVLLILFGRFVFLLIHLYYVLLRYQFLRTFEIYLSANKYKEMLSYGGWLTLNNLINPLMVYLDRFFLSLIVPTAAVTYYTTPHEMVFRLLFIPASLSRAIFPRLSGTSNTEQIKAIWKKSFLATLGIMGSITLMISLGSHTLLRIWLGGEFPDHSTVILIVLMLGVFVNSLAYTPYTLLQSTGRADITTKLNLFELPFYLLLFYILTIKYGILGAAIAWSLRFFIDCLLLFYVAKRI